MSRPSEILKNKVVSIKLAERVAIRKVLAEMKVLIPELIRLRTRSGAGLSGNLPDLKESTVKYRERYERRLSQETSPGESNLTATGQMLDAITAKVIGNKITVTINDKKRKKELSGSKSKLTNNEVRGYIEKNFAKFFELTNDEKEHLIELATEMIKEEIINQLNK